VPEHFLEDHAGVEGDVLVLVAGKDGKEDVALRGDILDGGEAGAELAAEEAGEDVCDVLAGLKVEAGDVLNEEEEEVGVVCLLRELSEDLGDGLGWGGCVSGCGGRGEIREIRTDRRLRR